MDKTNQIRILNELIDNIRDSLLAKASRIPENWDGNEIRHWVADEADSQRGRIGGQRRDAYLNDVAVLNL